MPILPIACAWARRQESLILRKGTKLSDTQRALASIVGIARPEQVRVLIVDRVPPRNRMLRALAGMLRLVSAHTIGMALRYGIFIRGDHCGETRLLLHELAHVAQYERMGGFGPFLKEYLAECIDPGYPHGDLEQEARRAEACGENEHGP